MKIRLIRHETIEDYISADPQGRAPFGCWLVRVRHLQVMKPIDLVRNIGPASLLRNQSYRIVFSIGKFRMICQYMFDRKRVYLIVCWLGTLVEYNNLKKIDRQRIITLH